MLKGSGQRNFKFGGGLDAEQHSDEYTGGGFLKLLENFL